MSPKTAVVTGGNGFIGSHLVDRLIRDGHHVIVIDWDARADLLKRWGDAVQFIEEDVRDLAGFWTEPDVIFHLASPVGPLGVLTWAGRITDEVVGGCRAAAYWAQMYQCPLVYVSTSEIYGGGDRGLCAEDSPRTVSPVQSARLEYQTAKLAAEVMLLNTVGLDVRIIRPFNVAGPRQSSAGGFVLPRFIEQALAGEPLTVYEPGTQRRALTHVLDIVDGIVRSWTHGKPGRDYNLGNPANTATIMELAHDVTEFFPDATIEVVDPVQLHGEAFKEAAEKFPDASRAIAELDWHPFRSRAKIIVDAIEALQ